VSQCAADASLPLHDFHTARNGRFAGVHGQEFVVCYQSPEAEYLALTQSVGLVDLSGRSRLCVLGADREKFLHGQVTNDVLRLKTGEGCYAALVNGKGKIQSDLFIYKLKEEILLDFEPGLSSLVTERLQKYIIAEDVQIVDVGSHYGLLSIQGPKSAELLKLAGFIELPQKPLAWISKTDPEGEFYLAANRRFGLEGFDLFIPLAALPKTAALLEQSGQALNASWIGWDACEIARIENGIPRFGIDMTEANLAPECGIEQRAISYSKGCYIGQEVIARIRTYGQVSKALRLLRLPNEITTLPAHGEKLFKQGKEVGYITSSTLSPKHGAKIALGYVRKEHNSAGETLELGAAERRIVHIIGLPMVLSHS
jgi:folate-binding protein YgfZ